MFCKDEEEAVLVFMLFSVFADCVFCPICTNLNLTSKMNIVIYNVFQHCHNAANPGFHAIICKPFIDSTCTAYKESSGYIGDIRYCELTLVCFL